MANNNFNTDLKIIDSVQLGARNLVDKYTEALWIFDGSEVAGKIKDWSSNENHLIPSESLHYTNSPFGRVLKVEDSLSFISSKTIDIDDELDSRCIEILFSTNVENDIVDDRPFVTFSGLFDSPPPRIASYLCRSTDDPFSSFIAINRAGGIQLYRTRTDFNTFLNNPLVDTYVFNENRYQQGASPVSGDYYYQALYPKNWWSIGINYPAKTGYAEYVYINGLKYEIPGTNPIKPFYGNQKFEVLPHPEFNQTKNLALIRLSSKQREPQEIQEAINYFAHTPGYFKNVKIFDAPQGNFMISKLQSDGIKTFDHSFEYSVPSNVEVISSGVRASQRDVLGNIALTYSGIPTFDFDELGSSRGMLIEGPKENLFKHAAAGRSDFSNQGWVPSWPSNADVNYDHDPCTTAVHGGHYGETNSEGFHYWNYTSTFTNSGIYTLSMFVKRTYKVNDPGFRMTISDHGTSSNFDFVDPYIEVIDAHPLFDSMAQADSNRLIFQFAESESYSDWQRLWVTFKMFTDHTDPYLLQITQDNRYGQWGYTGKSRWAFDCTQFEEGGLSSWHPEWYGDKAESYFKIDTSDYLLAEKGTVMFDYHNYNTYSGIAGEVVIANIGPNTQIKQIGQRFRAAVQGPGGGASRDLDQDITGEVTARLAYTWNGDSFSFYRLDTEPDQTSFAAALLDNSNLDFITYSGTTVSGVSFHIKNIKMFQRDLTIDELKVYD